jgi:hypothetical protein
MALLDMYMEDVNGEEKVAVWGLALGLNIILQVDVNLEVT